MSSSVLRRIEKHGLTRLPSSHDEAGVDISKHYSKTLEEIGPMQFDCVVTVAAMPRALAHLPGKTQKVHVGFEDPAAAHEGMRMEEKLGVSSGCGMNPAVCGDAADAKRLKKILKMNLKTTTHPIRNRKFINSSVKVMPRCKDPPLLLRTDDRG